MKIMMVEYYDCPLFEDDAKESCIKRAGSTCRVQNSYGLVFDSWHNKFQVMDSAGKHMIGYSILTYCRLVGHDYAKRFSSKFS